MKNKIFILSLLTMLVVAACAPSQPAVDVAEPEAMVEEAEPALEESEAMPAEEETETADSTESHDTTTEMEAAAEVSFSADVWPIIEKYALNAHGGNGGVFLESYDDIVLQVVPGDPENSRLYKVLIADGEPQMPPGNPLPEETIQVIYDWIAQGAKNN